MLKVIKQSKNLNMIKILEDSGAILQGHFKLTSGSHSNYYLQCAQLLRYPDLTCRIADETINMLSESINLEEIDMIVSPAMGGILFGYMLAYRSGIEMIYTERKKDKMELRRGFAIDPGKKIVIAEDVITTGGSVKEAVEICKRSGAEIKAVASIVDRSQNVDFQLPYTFLIQLEIENFLPKGCPMCKKGIPIDSPGSRK